MNLETLWKSVLAEIELSVSKPIYRTQFAQTTLVSLQQNIATIGCPNALMRTLVESRYYSLIKNILDQRTKTNNSLLFIVSTKKTTLTLNEAGPLFSQSTDYQTVDTRTTAKRLHIRFESTFETFAVSTSNHMAYAAATAVAKSPGTAYNPLFLYGGVGVGKTHLVHAVANVILTKKPNTKVVYCMGEEFLNEIIEAIQTKSARQFKQKYRKAELFLVDDVQFIAGKQTAQEEFFHTFNAVHREGGQIILTSDRSPNEIAKLEDRLRSRFEQGLIVDISQPDFELRVAISNIKSNEMHITLPEDASKLIAANMSEARSIEGFLKRLSSESLLKSVPITTDMVMSLLKIKPEENDANGHKNNPRISPQELLEKVAKHFELKPSTLKGPKRDRPIARPRQVVMYLCKTELGLTLDDIGGLLGGRDHTTVMHGVNTITHELSVNGSLRAAVEGIKQILWV
ncbi:chromosomal replication initiator protein DnaA [Candidatus Gottesmanbacteria bacterium]|nr:chromosomal replication initiator protein DnaA [Candidatus Gottesmanbacteria bacterium]